MNESIKSAAAEQTEKNEAIDKRADQIVADVIAALELNSRMIAVASENMRKRILFTCIIYLEADASQKLSAFFWLLRGGDILLRYPIRHGVQQRGDWLA